MIIKVYFLIIVVVIKKNYVYIICVDMDYKMCKFNLNNFLILIRWII